MDTKYVLRMERTSRDMLNFIEKNKIQMLRGRSEYNLKMLLYGQGIRFFLEILPTRALIIIDDPLRQLTGISFALVEIMDSDFYHEQREEIMSTLNTLGLPQRNTYLHLWNENYENWLDLRRTLGATKVVVRSCDLFTQLIASTKLEGVKLFPTDDDLSNLVVTADLIANIKKIKLCWMQVDRNSAVQIIKKIARSKEHGRNNRLELLLKNGDLEYILTCEGLPHVEVFWKGQILQFVGVIETEEEFVVVSENSPALPDGFCFTMDFIEKNPKKLWKKLMDIGRFGFSDSEDQNPRILETFNIATMENKARFFQLFVIMMNM